MYFTLQEMASQSRWCLPIIQLLLPLLRPLDATAWNGSFNAIYQFGDSLSDTGNLVKENATATACVHLPYGETFFHHPTGRCCDGRLMVDFFAKAFHLPLLNPYLDKDANFVHGVNFAVGGATALDPSFLAEKNITTSATNSSLSVQLGWFRTHLESICSSKAECKNRLGKALLFLGQVGGDDYGLALREGQSVKDIYELVPDVVHAIKDAVKEVIDLGAAQVVVPGFFPMGCIPFNLVHFASNDTSNYDRFMCIKVMNEFSEYHNRKLEYVLKELQGQHPSVSILYGDYYSAFIWVLENAASLGFAKDEVFNVCCGDGNNPYNYNISTACGSQGVSACPDPEKRVNWDGIHLTQQAYMYLTSWLLEDNGFVLPATYKLTYES